MHDISTTTNFSYFSSILAFKFTYLRIQLLKMHRRLVKSQSPIINESFQRKQLSKTSISAFTWMFINAPLAVIFLIELVWGCIANYFGWHHPVLWYAECGLAIWFSVSFLSDLFLCFRPLITNNTIMLTPHQKKLLGIRQTDSGFKVYSQSSSSPIVNQKDTFTPSLSPFSVNTPTRPSSTTPPRSSNSFSRSPGSYTPPGSLYTSPADTSLRHSRHSSPRKSPYSPNECINNLDTLRDFLKEQEEEDTKLQRAMTDSLSTSRGPSSCWSAFRNDFTPQLGVYRIARRSPDSTLSRDDDDTGYSTHRSEDMWLRLGVSSSDLDYCTENCRKWLCQTIFVRLVEQIDSVNDILCKIGCQDYQVGAISLSSLRHVAQIHSHQVPFLLVIIPYLEASNNQEYLVQRIRKLAKGGCMSVYRWNSGGKYRGKEWQSNLITDSQLVMHMFCTYMDSRLPADPRFPDGRTFTGLHFLKTPDKPDARKSELCIYLSRPLHYKVVVEDEVYDLGKGRNNLFHAIIFFLFQVKTKESGMLGRVNLGQSGVNILCIINKK